MGKMTLIYEQDSAVIGGNSKTTVEAEPLTLTGAVAVFERFLKGAGFEFDGKINLNNITQPSSCGDGCSCNGTDIISLGDVNLDISNYGAAQPYFGYDEFSGIVVPPGIDTITLTGTNPEAEYPEINIDLEPIKKKNKK